MKKTKIGIAIITSLTLVSLVLAGVVTAEPLFEVKDLKKAKEVKDLNKVKYVADEIIVKFKGDAQAFQVIKVPSGKVAEKIKEYLAKRDVEYAEPNYLAYALWTPNDPYYSYQWHFDQINLPAAWDTETGDPSVVVAVIDTGIAYENNGWSYKQASDLAQTCFKPGYDFVNNDTHPNDDASPGHGTHVAGTIAQSTNNNLGVAGIAFDTCLMPVKVLSSSGSGSYADVADGIIWAANHGADVINLSLGGSADSNTLKNAVAYAYNQGVTVVAAAGNDGSNPLNYPAAYDDYVIGVGATRYDETLAYYSNYGPSLDLVAPGGDLNVDQNGDGYVDGVLQQTYTKSGWRTTWGYYFMSGTSMASPHVAGTAALLIANGKATTPDEVRTILQETAKDLGQTGRDNTYGWGLLDAAAALDWTSAPECTSDTDCNDGVSCTDDSCVGGECLYTTNDSYCSADGWVDTGNTQWVTTGQCTEKEQKEQEYRNYYCDFILDCQFTVTGTQWVDTGVEKGKAEGAACDDGQFCTVGETCQAGICSGGSARDCSTLSDQCNDGVCDEVADSCLKEPANEGLTCNDGQFCTVGENCQVGVCSDGATPDCSDGVACTIDSCDEVSDACLNTPDNSYCSDGLFCNGEEICQATSSCQTGTPVECDDGNACTINTCSETLKSCSYTDVTACSSGDGCCPAGCDFSSDNDCPEVPATEEFTFTGTVPAKGESRHKVTVSSSGAASLNVKLSWSGWSDLRLRIYNPSGAMVAEVDKSSWRNKVEETTINNLAAGDWQVAAYSENRRSSVDYTIEGVVNY